MIRKLDIKIRYYMRLRDKKIEYEDLYQEAMIGLNYAIDQGTIEIRVDKEFVLREGREEGLRTGINYGELQNLVRMVLKKMRKDVSCEITAELFEEPVEKIRKIYEVAEKYAPEYDIESICRELAA